MSLKVQTNHLENLTAAFVAGRDAVAGLEEFGYCGFSWVVVGGNSGLVRYLKANDIGHKNYSGGWAIWCDLPTQCMTIKEVWARAVAASLRESYPDLSISWSSRAD